MGQPEPTEIMRVDGQLTNCCFQGDSHKYIKGDGTLQNPLYVDLDSHPLKVLNEKLLTALKASRDDLCLLATGRCPRRLVDEIMKRAVAYERLTVEAEQQSLPVKPVVVITALDGRPREHVTPENSVDVFLLNLDNVQRLVNRVRELPVRTELDKIVQKELLDGLEKRIKEIEKNT